ncbi:rab-like protein 3 isoform X2 [Dreissena polymorpha]|uniref:rab-like protein 3 isoform X2 n=1 Tax=Dreissena polymorpha TaxID=45954 RepID=UPI002264680C|nr:rab-like protein 3 isoform X2 [Dreissena polymorpha]XP_052281538.1 rab-like protein 3 isoform X2 [Dreissena polymorpha]
MANVDKVKILVVGDSGVGKTSLVHLICHNEPTNNPGWTIGCSVDVKLHEYKAGTAAEKTFFIELWDIGGCTSHQDCRSMFYTNVHGIILVHDLTNRKSQQNLQCWLGEVLRKENKISGGNGFDLDSEQFVGNQLPLLVIGTKADQTETIRDKNRQSSVAEEFGADQFDLDNYSVKYLAPGSTNAVKLSRFFDKVIERRYYSREVLH